MKTKFRKELSLALCFLAGFLLWTVLVRTVDVEAIGPGETTVGLTTLNGAFHRLTGVHLSLYNLTDLLGLVPLGLVAGFALVGLVQWIRRKRLRRVDPGILALGGCYGLVLGAYVFFEIVVVNFRPLLIDGRLEASYPSSTTMLVMTVLPTAIMELRPRIRRRSLRRCITAALALFAAFMVLGRLLSGVHWLSDIIGGALLSTALVLMYRAFAFGRNAQ